MINFTSLTLRWNGDSTGDLVLIDQTLLPGRIEHVVCQTADDVWHAIKVLRVRGAPAIGVAAAYGVIVGTRTSRDSPVSQLLQRVKNVCEYLATSRPTAVNLFWALDRMQQRASQIAEEPGITSALIHDAMLDEAIRIEHEDQEMCSAIGRHGNALLKSGMTVLTHCNAGALATAGDGTALSVIYAAISEGKQIQVFADETRPLLQGARLTAWELQQRNVPVTLICDNMAAQVMKEGRIDMVITGADRIAANGDSANKIGTYGVAVLAKHHRIPFCIAAPSSTFDFALTDGSQIPIEQRSEEEITEGFGRRTAPEGISVYNPAFDVTPAELIHAIITERGVICSPTSESISRMLR
jgi:methylthioribose-1-phosphate isomerase